jgi:hypothetical protein
VSGSAAITGFLASGVPGDVRFGASIAGSM